MISVWSRTQDKFRESFREKKFNTNKKEFGDKDIYWRQDGLDVPRFYHLYGKEEFVKDLEEAGFNIVSFKSVKIKSKKYDDNYFAIVRV